MVFGITHQAILLVGRLCIATNSEERNKNGIAERSARWWPEFLFFYDRTAFPAKCRNGAFITQHGFWNRAAFSGYGVVFVSFAMGIATLPNGSLLVADDAADKIWRVSANR